MINSLLTTKADSMHSKQEKKKKREQIRDRFRSEWAKFVVNNGFSDDEEAAKALGRSKFWIFNLIHKKSEQNVRTPTELDYLDFYNYQKKEHVKGNRIWEMNLSYIQYGEDKPYNSLHDSAEIKRLRKEVQKLSEELLVCRSKLEVYQGRGSEK